MDPSCLAVYRVVYLTTTESDDAFPSVGAEVATSMGYCMRFDMLRLAKAGGRSWGRGREEGSRRHKRDVLHQWARSAKALSHSEVFA